MTSRIVTFGSDETDVETARAGDVLIVREPARSTEVRIRSLADGEAEMEVNGRLTRVPFVRSAGAIEFFLEGDAYRASVEDKTQRRKGGAREHSLAAPMPSAVLRIFVSPGDVVVKGAPLLILEAMKMEHQISAPRDGKVASVKCSVGELVQPGVDLVVLEPA